MSLLTEARAHVRQNAPAPLPAAGMLAAPELTEGSPLVRDAVAFCIEQRLLKIVQ
jgi:hypothetical protein